MRILLYGFGPYRQFRDNVTAQIVRALPTQAGLKKVIFPVRFQRRQFIDALNRHKPDVILGLGQSSRKQIEVEARATNRRRVGKLDRPRPIFKGKPKSLATTLSMRAGRWAGMSKDAGDYVCNYSMFVLLDEIGRRQMKTRFGFIHIPHDCDHQKATRYVLRILRQVHPLLSSKSPSLSRLEVRL
jgi:pyrrolidone-carboxylate peptidase